MGFCRAKFWAKFPFWRGAVRGEVFREVCREVFHEVFGLVLLGHSEQQKKKFSKKTSALNSHGPAQQNWRNLREKASQRALRDRLMSRGKNCLPIVSRQFLTRNYPRPNCLLKCLPNCLSPTREGFLSSFKINPAVRVIARQVRDKNCLAAFFCPATSICLFWPTGFMTRFCRGTLDFFTEGKGPKNTDRVEPKGGQNTGKANHMRSTILFKIITGRPLKTTFDMTTLIFSSGGCPSYPFYPLKRVPSYPFLAENPSSEGATKDHLSSKPPQGEPPGTKNRSGR